MNAISRLLNKARGKLQFEKGFFGFPRELATLPGFNIESDQISSYTVSLAFGPCVAGV
jgi:hypothetical protein